MSLKSNSKKLKKIIIYSASPFFDTWPKKFKLNEFNNYGLDVECWSNEKIFFKPENIEAASNGSKEYLYKDLDVIKFNNLENFENKVAELNSEVIICIMVLGPLNNSDLDIFNKYKVKYILHHLIPHPVVPNTWFRLKHYIKLLHKRISNHKKKPFLIIGSGIQGRKQVFKLYKKNFIYKSLPSPNILWSKEKPIIEDKYIVYVEEAADAPPDVALFGLKNPNYDIEGFYRRINDVFAQIEMWTNFRVVIAASGKYNYKQNPFKNREIIYKKTSTLIQHSELVLGHKSLGVEQAIVDFKPLILFKDIGFSKLKNKIIHNLGLVYGINSIWTTQLNNSNFKKNLQVEINNNKRVIEQYYKEENINGSFVKNFTSIFHQL